jgi:NAD(P)-dependent dehydrogenase (short-subunit alcohol dehydrogenase family)
MRFSGRTVLIFGGNSGIGLAAAQAFRAEGARLAITGRNATSLAEAARETGAFAIRSDIASVTDTEAVIAEVWREMGQIDILFVNAGVGGFSPLPDMTEAFWDSVHSVNLRGCVFALQKSLPLIRDGGAIVITGSIGSVLALPGNLAYAAAKAGLRAAARVLAAELLPRRIRVNMVSPGPTETEIFKRGAPTEEVTALRDMMTANVPMQRMGSAEEIARAVLFLASEDASFINGVDLFVDGGCVEL